MLREPAIASLRLKVIVIHSRSKLFHSVFFFLQILIVSLDYVFAEQLLAFKRQSMHVLNVDMGLKSDALFLVHLITNNFLLAGLPFAPL